ncbi:hypothetical protein quinque_004961 [Culex quinquefasciatus]
MGRMDEVEERWRICAIGSVTCLVILEVDGRTSYVRRQVKVKWNRRGRPEEKANPSPFRHLQTLPHCALQTPRCVRFAYQLANPNLGAGSPCDPHDTRSVPYGDRHARRSQLYTVPVWELPVATPPFCSEEHPCRDHNRHRICQPLQPDDAGNQAIRWTCPPKSWTQEQTQERRGRRRGEGPSTR